jgi:hypothetical protein
MTEKEIQEANAKFLGKRVSVKYKDVYAGHEVVGTCTFLGINENFSDKGLQVTVARMPIWGIQISDISFATDHRTI